MLRAAGPDGLRGLEDAALAEAAAGRLTPVVQRFPLAEAAAAHAALEGRRTMGKVVLVP
jgi:NADPH2:quinone reductase